MEQWKIFLLNLNSWDHIFLVSLQQIFCDVSWNSVVVFRKITCVIIWVGSWTLSERKTERWGRHGDVADISTVKQVSCHLKGSKDRIFFANIKLEFSSENGILEILYLPLWTSQILNTLRSVMILINSSFHIVQWKVSTSGRYALVNEPIFSKWPMYDVTKSRLITLAIQSARQINEF